MAIDDYKVTNAEVQAAHVQAAPNTLTGTAQENKAVFDGYPELLKEKHNGLIDELDDALAEQVDWEEGDDTTPAYIKNKPIIKKGTGTGSIIENDTNNIASGSNSHAEGNSTEASGDNSHAEGDSTEASGLYAHAEGTTTLATGTGSHTEGYLTKAAESYTHANGVGTEAHGYAETVIGQYNDYDAMNEPYAFVIGNGNEDGDRSNAHTTDWQGNAWYAGEVTDGTGNMLSEKVDKEAGKGLSTNDYTTAEKMKLSGIAAGAEVNVQADWEQSNSDADDYINNKPYIPTKTSDLTNDSDFTTSQYVDAGLGNKVDVETGKGLSANDYTSEEKAKLEDIEAGAEVNVQSDWSQNNSSADDYIKNKPTLPTKTSDLTNDSDYTTKQYVDGKLPIGEASGSIACVKDGADGMPMKSLTATITPQQSGTGTPSPDNVRPISGWSSVNLYDTGKNMANMIADGTTPSISTGALVLYAQSTRSQMIRVNPSTAYVASFGNTLLNGIFQYDKDGNFIRVDQTPTATTIAVTTTNTTAFIMLRCDRNSTSDPIPNCQFELGTTATAYTPYIGTTTPVNLGRTVYGGTLDVVSGVLTVDKGFATFDGSSDETWFNNGSVGVYTPKASLPNVKPIWSGVTILSNQYTQVVSGQASTVNGKFNWNDNMNALQFRNDNALNATDFRAALSQNPVTIVYPLAEPQTYQLTPQTINTLAGVNNVWAESGDCEIVYVRDIGLALDNVLPESPTTDGTYTLVCTVTDGQPTIAWQSNAEPVQTLSSTLSSPTVLNNPTVGE